MLGILIRKGRADQHGLCVLPHEGFKAKVKSCSLRAVQGAFAPQSANGFSGQRAGS